MDFTFGIITYEGADDYINIIIESIEKEEIPNYEIIVVGDYQGTRENTKVIPFDETVKAGWITRKKNIITENAKNDIIVYSHDYIKLNRGFYNGWKSFGDDWDIAMNVIENTDGSRYRDWCVWDDPVYGEGRLIAEPWCAEGKFFKGRAFLPPYSYTNTKCMCISGAYWLAKKHVMQSEPLDENLLQSQGEDIEWSKRAIPKYKYTMNTNASVRLLKHHDQPFPMFNP